MSVRARWGRVFLGLFFLTAAGILGASQMGWITYNFDFWTVAATIVLAAIIIRGLVYLDPHITVFGLALLSMLYAGPLGIEKLVPWTVLGIALLVSIGLGFMLNPLRHRLYARKMNKMGVDWEAKRSSVKTDHTSDVNVNVKLGNAVRYVKTPDFHRATVNLSMGEARVYFEDALINEEPATIAVNGNMGEIVLYVPRDWNVEVHIDAYMATVDEMGETPTRQGAKVEVVGSFRLGDLQIHYV